jgi:vanillate O-demethylase monooxygenase subunit
LRNVAAPWLASGVICWQICHFLPPSSVIIDVGVALVAAGDNIGKHDHGVRGFVIDAFTPESDTSSHCFWGMSRYFDIHHVGLTGSIKGSARRCFPRRHRSS